MGALLNLTNIGQRLPLAIRHSVVGEFRYDERDVTSSSTLATACRSSPCSIYFPEGHDPTWLLLDVAMDVRSGDPIRVARRDFSIEGPDGLRVPLSTLPAFRRAYRQLRPMMLQLHTRERPIAGFFPVPCADHNFRFFVPTGELRLTEVHASWQGSCVRGDLFFEAPDGVWGGGAYTLVIGGDTDVRLPIEIE